MVDKVKKVMHEFKHGTLHSGSKHGPKVTKRSQALAIAMSEQDKADRGHADGGPVDLALRGARDIASRTIEMTARAAGTEGGRNLNKMDRMLRQPTHEAPRVARAAAPSAEPRSDPGGGLDMKIEEAEKRSLQDKADGGLIRSAHKPNVVRLNSAPGKAGGGYVADPHLRDGGFVQHRDMHTGRYRDGGVVHDARKIAPGPRPLSDAACARFAENCKGRVTKVWPKLPD